MSAIAAHPTSAATYYIGGADGGVWKSNSDLNSWTPLTDAMPTNAIGCITVDPTNPQRMYVGTGEPNRAKHTRYGLGVYRSEDAGTTWVHLPRSGGVHVAATFDGRCISRICVNPTSPSNLFAEVTRSVGDRNGKRHPNGGDAIGLYKSSDYGESWSHVPSVGGTNWACTDVTHVSGNIFLAAAWDQSGSGSKIYRSVDAGLNWTVVGSGFYGRIALAAGTGGSVVYALDSPYSDHRLWRSADSGQTWKNIHTQSSDAYHLYEALVLAVNPSDSNKVYFGGTYPGFDDLRRLVYPALTVTDIGTPHEDIRSIAWRADGRLMVGNDGGLEISATADTGPTWDPVWVDRNNQSLGITQILPGFAVDPGNANYIYAGTQDNSNVTRTTVGSRTWWHTVGSGDGGANVVDTDEPAAGAMAYRVYTWPRTGGGGLYWSDDYVSSWSLTTPPGPPFVYCIYHMLVVDVTFSGVGGNLNPLFVGAKPVLVGIWDPLLPDVVWQPPRSDQLGDSIRGLAIASHPSQRLYATWNNRDENNSNYTSYVMISDDSGFNFHSPVVAPANFEHWKYGTRDIAVDRSNPDVAYCVSSRWRTALVPNRVFFTSDGGSTWTGRDGAATARITDAPCNAVAVIRLSTPQRRILVGTDQGVWISIDDGLTWGKYGTGLPNSSVDDVIYDAQRRKILVATLGRGIWSVDYPAAVADIAGASAEGVPDGQIDESDLNAYMKWMANSDLDSKDPEKQDLRADADGDGLVTVEDGLLFLEAYKGGW